MVTLPFVFDESRFKRIYMDGKLYVVVLNPGEDVALVADEHCFGIGLTGDQFEVLKASSLKEND